MAAGAGRSERLRPDARQTVVLAAALVVVVGAVAALAWLVPPTSARAFDLVTGSLYVDDDRAPVAIDLATGGPTVRLIDADDLVGADSPADVHLVPLRSGTLAVDTRTGEFNVLDPSGLAVRSGGGVRLPGSSAGGRAGAWAAGELAYVVRTRPTGTDLYLVGRAAVQGAQVEGSRLLPRAWGSLPGGVDLAPGAAAVAGTDLWLLHGDAGGRRLHRVGLPTGAGAGRAGERLRDEDLGPVTGPAALATLAAPSAQETSAATVALASATEIAVHGPGGIKRLSLPSGADVDEVIPGAGGPGFAFLLHGRQGWSLVAVDAAGTRLSGPYALDGLPAGARAVAPAWSAGAWWTLTSARGGAQAAIWRIGTDGQVSAAPGAAAYPVVTRGGAVAEAGGFDDATVTSVGSRVVVNSRSHLRALTVFADGSHPPVVVDKSAATSLDASGQAAALLGPSPTASSTPTGQPPAADAPPPAQAVDAKLRCSTTAQVPHVPVVTSARTTSRSLTLRWAYPVLDPADCLPSTYRVELSAADPGAPAPPGTVTVQGQTGSVIAGLFPGTRYRVVVTALLHGRGTPSLPALVTTGPEGPAAPRDLRVDAQGRQGWRVSWTACGQADGCVPAAAWTVTPSFCDGVGLSSMPAPVPLAGDPTQRRFSVDVPGGSALLGRGLTFSVVGTSVAGDGGDPRTSGCSYTWQRPDPSAMTLTASAPPASASSTATTTTTVSLDLGSDPLAASGGLGAKVTFQLLRGGDVIATRDAGGDLTATFEGIEPGREYSARAVVSPPRHPEAAVTVGPVPIERALALWPPIQVDTTWQDNGSTSPTGVLLLRLHGLDWARDQGESFDLVDSSLTCGNASLPLNANWFQDGQELRFDVDRLAFHGECRVTLRLSQNAPAGAPGPLYGPNPTSPVLRTAPLSVDVPRLTGVSADQFRARWAGADNGRSLLEVAYTGGNPLLNAAAGWTIEVSGDGGAHYSCGSTSPAPTTTVAVDDACVRAAGDDARAWRVRVRFDWFGDAQGPYEVTSVSGGAPPIWQSMCLLSTSDLKATWSGTSSSPRVAVAYTPGDSHLDGCSAWRLELLTPDGNVCGSTNAGPDADAAVTVGAGCGADTGRTGWQLRWGWTDGLGRRGSTLGPGVTGTPP